MSRKTNILTRLLLLCAVLLLFCATATAAVKLPYSLRLEWSAGEELLYVEPVSANSLESFFLPGCCPAGSLTIRITGTDELLFAGKTVKDGDTIDCTPYIGQSITISLTDTTYAQEYNIMQGSAISSMFFNVAQSDLDNMYKKKSNDLTKPASIVVVEADGSVSCSDELTSMHTRGNTTRRQSKRPFQIKLKHKADLGGMGESKTWILLANWFDVSLLRNQITYDLARETGIAFTPQCRQTDVYLNGRYNGTYLLSEKIQISKERVDITNLEKATEAINEKSLSKAKRSYHRNTNLKILTYFDIPNEPEDVTGGYILEIEKNLSFEQNKENAGFRTEKGMFIIIKEPSQAGERAALYVGNLVNDLHNAACAQDGVNTKTGHYYLDLIDGSSFAAKFLIEEITENFDAVAGSQFLYKDSDAVDSKLHAGPCWDYDLSYGNKGKGPIYPDKDDYLINRSTADTNLYRMLYKHEDFQQLVASHFRDTTLPALRVLTGQAQPAEGSLLKSIDEYAAEISASAEMNFTRWRTVNIDDLYKKSGTNFTDAVSYLKSWLTRRADTLEANWAK